MLLLIASFGALSGLYVLLDAPFVAVIQIIVYAGAIMVLFLFVVMLLNAPHEDTEEDLERAASGSPSAGPMRVRARCSRWRSSSSWSGRCCASRRSAGVFDGRGRVSSVAAIGRSLFTDYAFPFEVTSVLILVAMVGAVRAGAARDGGERRLMPTLNHYLVLSADPVRDRHRRRVPAPQPDHDPAVDRDHAERREPDVRGVRPRARHAPTARSSCSS